MDQKSSILTWIAEGKCAFRSISTQTLANDNLFLNYDALSIKSGKPTPLPIWLMPSLVRSSNGISFKLIQIGNFEEENFFKEIPGFYFLKRRDRCATNHGPPSRTQSLVSKFSNLNKNRPLSNLKTSTLSRRPQSCLITP